jgi:NodT family efflux transporter outer membrane factor (OMF) lipoprotein
MVAPSKTAGNFSTHTKQRFAAAALAVAVCLTISGCCTSFREYVQNGFKVGPNYCPPDAEVAERWIDSGNKHLREDEVPCLWWTLFKDPVLNNLVRQAYGQNLRLKEACCRILQARAKLDYAKGNLFPQTQGASGSYYRSASSGAMVAGAEGPASFSSQWSAGFNLKWELDFWGRYRRAIDAASDLLEASAFDYDEVLVTMLGDVASNYVTIRTDQERIKFLRDNVELQRGVLQYVERRFKAGFRVNELDVDQARSTLAQTEAQIPVVEIEMRKASDALCVLLGMPAGDLTKQLGTGKIPQAPAEIAIGLPADLLRRRPDVQQAERLAMAQAEQIGIAETDLYPAFNINGDLGWRAAKFGGLFSSNALSGSVGPSFQWNLLNYGRIKASICYEDAYFRELVLAYQRTVLEADQEVEDGLIAFLRQHERARLLEESVDAAEKAVKIVVAQFEKGSVDFNRYATIAQNLVGQQDSCAQARGDSAKGLIQVYRALGGGWELRYQDEGQMPRDTAAIAPAPVPFPVPAAPQAEPAAPAAPERLPAPKPRRLPPRNDNQAGDERAA